MKSKLFISLILSTCVLTTTFAQRKVLVEQFTNSGCPPCAGNTPLVAAYVNSNLNTVLMLSYHTKYPYLDSMYYENSFQADQRVAYYNGGGVPNSIVDGNYFSGNLVPSISTTIPARAAIAPKYAVIFSSNTLNNSTVNVDVIFQSLDAMNQTESLTARVVVAEKNVLKNSYVCCAGANIETEYPWVVRKMLPDENGTTLVNTQLNGVDNVSLSWTANNFKDLTEMRIVAFVQNTVTKEVYQTEISNPINVTAVNEIKHNQDNLFKVFPTIAKDYINFQINKIEDNSQIKIMDVLGNIIYSQNINASFSGKLQSISTSNFQNGIYIVLLGNETGAETNKIIINK